MESHIPSVGNSPPPGWILGRIPNFGAARPQGSGWEQIVRNPKNLPQKEALGTLHPPPPQPGRGFLGGIIQNLNLGCFGGVGLVSNDPEIPRNHPKKWAWDSTKVSRGKRACPGLDFGVKPPGFGHQGAEATPRMVWGGKIARNPSNSSQNGGVGAHINPLGKKSAPSEPGLTFLGGNRSVLTPGSCGCWVYPITQNAKNSLIPTKMGGLGAWGGGVGPRIVPIEETTPSERVFLGEKPALFGIRELIISAARWRMGENYPKSLKFIPKQREWKERNPLEKKPSPS